MCKSFGLGPDFPFGPKGREVSHFEDSPQFKMGANAAAKDNADLSAGLAGVHRNSGRGISLERTQPLDQNRQAAAKFIVSVTEQALQSLKQYSKGRMNPLKGGTGHWGDWVSALTGKSTISQEIKNMETLLSKAKQLENCKSDQDFDFLFRVVTGTTYDNSLVSDAFQMVQNGGDSAETEFALKRAFGNNQGNADVAIARDRRYGRGAAIGFGAAIALCGAGALATAAAGAGAGAVAGEVATAAASTAGRHIAKKAAIAGGAAILAACNKMEIPEPPEAKNTNAGAYVNVTMSDIVDYLYNSVKDVKLSTGDKTADGKDIPVQFVVNGAGNKLEDIDLKIGSLTLQVAFTEEEVTYADGTRGPAFVGKPEKAIEAGQVIQYINSDLKANGAPANGDGKDYDFGTNVKTPVITFTAKDEKGNVKLDAEGKPITVSVPIDNNKPISLETMKEYITKILDKSFPEGAEFAFGKKDGKDGVTVKWNEVVGKTEEEIIKDLKKYLEERDIKIPDGATFSFENGKVVVHYDVTTTLPDNEVIDNFKEENKGKFPDGATYELKDGMITVKYTVETDLSEEQILANFKKNPPEPIPAGAEITYNGNGKVTVKWKLTDKEVVEKLNIDPNKKANYSIDANGNIIETFKVDGQDYTHQYGKTPKLDEKAQADFKPVADFLGLKEGIVLDFKTGDSSWDGSASWSRSLSIGLTGKDIDNAEYRVLMDGHEAKGKPEKQADGSVKIGNATFKLGERVVDNDGEELRFPSMEVSIDGRKYVLHYDDFGGDVGRGINQVEEDGQEVFFPENGKKTITFDTIGADKDYREYDRNQSKDFDVDTKEKKDVTDGPHPAVTTKTEHKADEYPVDGVKTEPREEFIEDKLTKNRDDAKKYYDEKKEHLDKVYQEAAAKLKIAPAAVAEAKARITNK